MTDHENGRCLSCTYGYHQGDGFTCDGFTFPLATYRCACRICREDEPS